MKRFDLPISLLVTLVIAPACFAQAGSCSGMSVGPLASLNGFVPFPADNAWNTDVSNAPVDANSANYIRYIGGSSVSLHPDFGAGLNVGQYMGVPYQIESSAQALVPIKLGVSASQSDPGPMPVPATALIQGYPKPGNGDRHVLVLDRDGCWLYELFNSHFQTTDWFASSTAIWDMTSNELRPYTWTSADAAGLPVFAGLVRYDEVSAGAINHAIRFTIPTLREAFTPPATHWASTVTDANALPYGARLRLKPGFDISGYSATNQVILKALKKYGMIAADNGGPLYLTGAPDPGWNNGDLHLLDGVTGADFEVVQIPVIYTPSNVPTGLKPVVSQFTAQPAVATSGQAVTLSWKASGASYTIVSPEAGPVRGNSVVVRPLATTTYKLFATNQYGRKTVSVTVTVQ